MRLSVALLVIAVLVIGCSKPEQSKPAASLKQLPYLGESRSAIGSQLKPYLIDYNPLNVDKPLEYYRFDSKGHLVRLAFTFAMRPDNADVLEGVSILPDDVEKLQTSDGIFIDPAARLGIVQAYLPDRKSLPVSALTSAEGDDAKPDPGVTLAFFRSEQASARVSQRPYWSVPAQKWVNDGSRCPAADTSDIETFTTTKNEVAVQAGVFSEWLSFCMRQDASSNMGH